MKKNILFAIPHLASGGAEKVLVDILNNLNYEYYNVTLFIFEKQGVHLERLDNRVKVISSYDEFYGDIRDKLKKSYKVMKYFPKIYYKLNIREKYDVEVAFLEGICTKLIANSINKNSKKISWVHCNFEKNHWTKIFYRKSEECNVYNKYNKIIFVSNEAKKSFSSIFNENYVDKSVIYNPIIVDEIVKLANEREINFEKKTIIAIGRLTEPKGFDRLIKAHSILVKEYSHDLLILGEGELKNELLKLVNDLGVENTVKMRGFVNNPYPFIKAANVFVLSSISEGYPLVIGEALALEKPIISTNISGAREILDDGNFGMLCDSSCEGLVNALDKILGSNEVLNDYKLKSKLGKESLDYNVIIRKIENLFNE